MVLCNRMCLASGLITVSWESHMRFSDRLGLQIDWRDKQKEKIDFIEILVTLIPPKILSIGDGPIVVNKTRNSQYWWNFYQK